MAVEATELDLPISGWKILKNKILEEGEENEKKKVHFDTICVKITLEAMLYMIFGCTYIIKREEYSSPSRIWVCTGRAGRKRNRNGHSNVLASFCSLSPKGLL